jgi:hypothetical protein
MSKNASATACTMLRDLMQLSPDDQTDALALVVRGWCGLRGHPWSEGEFPLPLKPDEYAKPP